MFDLHTETTAPVVAAEAMRRTNAAFGFVPNLFRVLAEAPTAYAAYEYLFASFEKQTAFSPLERQIVMMTANFANGCRYCMAAHSMMMSAAKMPDGHIAALRSGRPLADARLEALRSFAADVLSSRGHLPQDRIEGFLAAGYTRAQALELLVGLAAKLISNYAASLAEPPLDAPAKAFAWAPGNEEGAA
jgi:alkylhydroperoxidase family enzyme